MSSDDSASTSVLAPWLVRVPPIFAPVTGEVLEALEVESKKQLGQDYHLISTRKPHLIHQSEIAKFLGWNLPMEHVWPCNPSKIEDFIEKSAQALWKKFGERKPQGIFIGVLNPGSPDKYFNKLASNLRGRALQLFEGAAAVAVDAQDTSADSLFCLVGREGLYCGMSSPKQANGVYPGGSRFIDKSAPETISRAGAKIAEALDYLKMYRAALPAGSHWVELGACPGGMTSELLRRDQKVTAIDRAPLDPQLKRAKGLRFVHADVAEFTPEHGEFYDAILSDLNGSPRESLDHVLRLAPYLRKHGLVVFTLKVPKVTSVDAPCALYREIEDIATRAGLELIATTHLSANRHEFTLFFSNEKVKPHIQTTFRDKREWRS